MSSKHECSGQPLLTETARDKDAVAAQPDAATHAKPPLPPVARAQLRDRSVGQLLLLTPAPGALLVRQLAALRHSHHAPPLDRGAPAGCGACAPPTAPRKGCDSQAAGLRQPSGLAGARRSRLCRCCRVLRGSGRSRAAGPRRPRGPCGTADRRSCRCRRWSRWGSDARRARTLSHSCQAATLRDVDCRLGLTNTARRRWAWVRGRRRGACLEQADWVCGSPVDRPRIACAAAVWCAANGGCGG
jgi:hypothetical protein